MRFDTWIIRWLNVDIYLKFAYNRLMWKNIVQKSLILKIKKINISLQTNKHQINAKFVVKNLSLKFLCAWRHVIAMRRNSNFADNEFTSIVFRRDQTLYFRIDFKRDE